MLKVKIKILSENAVVPKYEKNGDAGMDLTVTEVSQIGGKMHYKFGIAIEIPAGHVGLLFPRSSIHKTNQTLTNSVGVIDSGYRGEIMAIMDYELFKDRYKPGERAVQIIILPFPEVEFETVDNLTESERGSGGYGSTGK